MWMSLLEAADSHFQPKQEVHVQVGGLKLFASSNQCWLHICLQIV